MIHHNEPQNRQRELAELPKWLGEEFKDYPHFWFMAWYGDYGIYVTMYEYGYRNAIIDEWYFADVNQASVFLMVKEEIKACLYPPLSSIWTDYKD